MVASYQNNRPMAETQMNSRHGEVSPTLPSKTRAMLTWAKDGERGELRYIGEISRINTGRRCNCICYGCGHPLEAVNAGVDRGAVAPHFRHPGNVLDAPCALAASRAVVLRILARMTQLELELPGTLLERSFVGLSGKVYGRDIRAARERVRVTNVYTQDNVIAVLCLADGREIQVSLSGSVQIEANGVRHPLILIESDDPSVVSLSEQEIRQRIVGLISNGRWATELLETRQELQSSAFEQAVQALDAPPLEACEHIGRTPSRETLVHWHGKHILASLSHIQLPDVLGVMTDSFLNAGVRQEEVTIRAPRVYLHSSMVEKSLGVLRPDVQCTMEGPLGEGWDGLLAMEVTVTHGIDELRHQAIARQRTPTIEVNLSALPRNIDLLQLNNLVRSDLSLRSWAYHPLHEQLAEYGRKRVEELSMFASPNQLAAKFKAEFVALCDKASFYGPYPTQEMMQRKLLIEGLGLRLEQQGYKGADIRSVLSAERLISRLCSIELNKPIGYRVNTLWQVINNLKSDRKNGPQIGHHYLCMLALKVYKPPFPGPRESQEISEMADEVRAGVEDPNSPYLRNPEYEKLVALLFPELTPGIQALERRARRHSKGLHKE